MRQKIRCLRLEVVGAKGYMSTTSIAMPKDLPSIEEALKLFAAISGLSGYSPWYFCGAESMKGKPWSVDEEKQLREMVQEHKRLSEIAGFFGKSSASVKMKISRLKLVVVVRQIHTTTTTNKQRKKELFFLFMPYKGFYVIERLLLDDDQPKSERSLSTCKGVLGCIW